MLLVQGPHFEEHRSKVLILFSKKHKLYIQMNVFKIIYFFQ